MEQFDEDSLNDLFVKVTRLHHRRVVELLEELELYYGQPPVLFALWERDGLTQTELAQRRKLTPATITATLKRMEKAGWLMRRTDSEDSRVSRVYLTEKGKNVRLSVEMKLKQLENETFKNFTTTEKALIRRFFLQMEENLKKTCKED
ncbi:MAG: MarR family transcriptional regulator, organic hydroperoxide resistance regulator [Petroclostridium sp.]|jgi:DNA-binding MarR family transcriptional regulator|nr:MarR family transcriptional regulator, organic hydroperoxide resistance regulator [Petroclostridium sp.]